MSAAATPVASSGQFRADELLYGLPGVQVTAAALISGLVGIELNWIVKTSARDLYYNGHNCGLLSLAFRIFVGRPRLTLLPSSPRSKWKWKR